MYGCACVLIVVSNPCQNDLQNVCMHSMRAIPLILHFRVSTGVFGGGVLLILPTTHQ